MKPLIIEIRRKEILIDEMGNLSSDNDIVEAVHRYYIQDDDHYRYPKNQKFYPSIKSAFKEIVLRTKKHPNKTYNLLVDYHDRLLNSNTPTLLFLFKQSKDHQITVEYGYEREFFCRIDVVERMVYFEEEDVNEGNQLFAEWLPKKINRQKTPIQLKIASLKRFNVQSIQFRGLVKGERKEFILNELERCCERINSVFPMADYYPIRELYFTKYANNIKGKYGAKPLSISLDARYTKQNDTVYHEYGHHLYDLGKFGDYLTWVPGRKKLERTKANEKAEELLTRLYQEPTLLSILEGVELRMTQSPKESRNRQDYYTKREEYLLRPNEVFARLVESYMLYLDRKEGKNLEYKLDFSEEEVCKTEPLLLEYFAIIRDDYKKEHANIDKLGVFLQPHEDDITLS